jgi:hypothetical protein
MSGGFINSQDHGEHQIVTFTFIGKLDDAKVKMWNDYLVKIKKTFGRNLAGITVKGDPTPERFMPRGRRKRKTK